MAIIGSSSGARGYRRDTTGKGRQPDRITGAHRKWWKNRRDPNQRRAPQRYNPDPSGRRGGIWAGPGGRNPRQRNSSRNVPRWGWDMDPIPTRGRRVTSRRDPRVLGDESEWWKRSRRGSRVREDDPGRYGRYGGGRWDKDPIPTRGRRDPRKLGDESEWWKRRRRGSSSRTRRGRSSSAPRKPLSPERQALADHYRRVARESMARRRGRAARMIRPGWKQRQQSSSRRAIGSRGRSASGAPAGWTRESTAFTRRLEEQNRRRRNSPRWQRMKKRTTSSARDKIDSGRARANPLWTDEAIAAHRELNKKRRAAWKRGERYQPEGNMRGKAVPGMAGVTNFSHLIDPKKMEAFRRRRNRYRR